MSVLLVAASDALLAGRSCAGAATAAAVAGYSSAAAAAHKKIPRRLGGDWPNVPSLPARSLLMRKLVQLEKLLQPAQQQQQPPPPLNERAGRQQQARAARRAAAQAYMSAVAAAAAQQDINGLLKHLSVAAAAVGQHTADPPQQLSAAAAATEIEVPASSSSPAAAAAEGPLAQPQQPQQQPLLQQQQQMPWLLPAALVAAAKQLAGGQGGKPQLAQALVELVLNQGLIAPQRAQRAIHAVLQAYYDAGDYPGVLAAASRFYGVNSSSSSSDATEQPGLDSSSSSSSSGPLSPSSVTLALMLDAAAAQGDAALLMGVWKIFGRDAAMQQQYQLQPSGSKNSSKTTSSSKSTKSKSSSSIQLPPPVVLHALTYGAVRCDLAAARKSYSQHSASSGSSSSSGGQMLGVAPVIFDSDSCTVEVLHDVQRMVQQQRKVQQQQGQSSKRAQLLPQQPDRASSRKSTAQHLKQLPLSLLHPKQASNVLGQCASAVDTDLLLLSQLCQPGGLQAEDLVSLQQKLHAAAQDSGPSNELPHALAGSSSAIAAINNISSSHSSSMGQFVAQPADSCLLQLLGELPAISNNARPAAFPPLLRADVARAAVAAYLRTGAFGRAAAVAQQAAVANPGDVQQLHLLVRGAARVGAVLPGLMMVTKLQDKLWQLPSQKAQAAMLRALARYGCSPPLGAAPSVARLTSFFSNFCSPNPRTWAALLEGYILAGDLGRRTFRTLRAAMSQPYSYVSMPRRSPEEVDRARSRIVAALLRGVLAVPQAGGRLQQVSETAALLLQDSSHTEGLYSYGNSGSNGSSSGSSGTSEEIIQGFSLSDAGTPDVLPRSLAAVLGVPSPAAAEAAAAAAAATQEVSVVGSAACHAPSSSSGSSVHAGLSTVQQQDFPGLPLQQQPAHTRLKVLLVLQILKVLKSWGVVVHDDAALAAALQVLRFCWDTEDARQSGLLVEVLKAALDLGMQPADATLRALLACCADLESRPGKSPLGLAPGPGFSLQDVGYVDLGFVLQACRDALQGKQQLRPDSSVAGAAPADADATGGSSSSSSGLEARRVAAQLLRTWVFESTFGFVEGVRTHGPAYASHWPEPHAAAEDAARAAAAAPCAEEAQAVVGV